MSVLSPNGGFRDSGGLRPVAALLILTAMVLGSPASAPAQEPAAPRAIVETFHETLLAVMKQGPTLRIDGRFARLAAAVERAFDLSRMIRVASGRHWGKASPAQRESLLAAFGRMSAATYASQFKSHDGESFEFVKSRDGPRGTRLVETQIVKSDGEAVPITYVMFRGDGEWRIADVLLDNSISELAVRRSEYRGVLSKGGAAGLIDILNGKADQLLSP